MGDQLKTKNNYMNYVHFFQWNIPADNHFAGCTDRYIDVVSRWDGKTFFNDGNPMIQVDGVNLSFYDCISVLDWQQAYTEIKTIARQHFAEIARMEKINQARAILAMNENPILERMELKLTEPLY